MQTALIVCGCDRREDKNTNPNLAFTELPMYNAGDGVAVFSGFRYTRLSGAIGFDWVIVDQGGVSWLISWPRKKLIKQ